MPQRSVVFARRLREWALVLALVFALASLVLFAWMTRQPAHPVFARLSDLPLVGGLVQEVRRPHLEAYRLRQKRASSGRAGTSESFATEGDQVAEETLADWGERQWIGIGAKLYSEKNRGSQYVQTVSLDSYKVLERYGSWLKLSLFDGSIVWVDRSEARDLRPPLGEAATPPGPLPPRSVSPERLELALASMDSDPAELTLGGYRCITDLSDAAGPLLRQLDSALVRVERQYAANYGLVPQGEPAETIALYRKSEAYVRVQAATDGIGGVVSTGHTTGGLVALAVGERAPWEVESTLVHEVTHLLNRRALGPLLPPWLSEGLATHLGQLGRRQEPELDPRFMRIEDEEIFFSGPLASLRVLAERATRGTLLGLADLTSVAEEQFKASASAALLYAQAAFFVDHLLEDPDLRPAFHRFLAGVANGQPASGEALQAELKVSWPSLDASFSEWLQARAERARQSS